MSAPRSLLLTHTDRLLTSDSGHPSLIDIAVGLSRQPRFGGQTGRWWSVIDHSLLCDELVQSCYVSGGWKPDTDDEIRRARLVVLLHDAHEGLTGDVPSPLKTPDFKAMQEELDRRIYGAYFAGGRSGFEEWLTKVIDLRALRVEAGIFLPHPTERIVPIFGEPEADDIVTLSEYLGEPYAALPPFARDQREHPAVKEYLDRVLRLL